MHSTKRQGMKAAHPTILHRRQDPAMIHLLLAQHNLELRQYFRNLLRDFKLVALWRLRELIPVAEASAVVHYVSFGG